MFETVIEASKALASWPVANTFFLLVIAFLGASAWRRGERDRKTASNSIEVPLYLMIQRMSEDVRKSNDILEDVARNVAEFSIAQKYTQKLIEDVRNNQELRGTGKRGI